MTNPSLEAPKSTKEDEQELERQMAKRLSEHLHKMLDEERTMYKQLVTGEGNEDKGSSKKSNEDVGKGDVTTEKHGNEKAKEEK